MSAIHQLIINYKLIDYLMVYLLLFISYIYIIAINNCVDIDIKNSYYT